MSCGVYCHIFTCITIIATCIATHDFDAQVGVQISISNITYNNPTKKKENSSYNDSKARQ